MLIGEVAEAAVGLGALLKETIGDALGHQVGAEIGIHTRHNYLLRQTSGAAGSVSAFRNTQATLLLLQFAHRR